MKKANALSSDHITRDHMLYTSKSGSHSSLSTTKKPYDVNDCGECLPTSSHIEPPSSHDELYDLRRAEHKAANMVRHDYPLFLDRIPCLVDLT